MGFPRLDTIPQTVPGLTIDQKIAIVDAFCMDRSPRDIKHELSIPVPVVKSLYDKLMTFYGAVLDAMNANPTMTAAQLQNIMYGQYPSQPEDVIDYILTKIVETTTEAGTYASFKACFPVNDA